jgi:hypothetical protein
MKVRFRLPSTLELCSRHDPSSPNLRHLTVVPETHGGRELAGFQRRPALTRPTFADVMTSHTSRATGALVGYAQPDPAREALP